MYHKINSVNLTIETLTTHNNRKYSGSVGRQAPWDIFIYRVIHEECHSFREMICHVMLMKKVHMNMGPIFHITGDMRSTIFEIEL